MIVIDVVGEAPAWKFWIVFAFLHNSYFSSHAIEQLEVECWYLWFSRCVCAANCICTSIVETSMSTTY